VRIYNMRKCGLCESRIPKVEDLPYYVVKLFDWNYSGDW